MILNVRMELVNEDTGEVFSRKIARIHETDLPAGKFHLILKSQEILIDALGLAFKAKKPEGMTWLKFAELKFEPPKKNAA
jgi:hypothetical protein